MEGKKAVFVDWKKILEDPPRPALRNVLCSGDATLLKDLYENGFTKYFTHNKPQMISRERVVEMFRGRVLHSTLDSFLLNYPTPFFLFDIVGFMVGNAVSFPVWASENEKKFIQSHVVVGRDVVYETVKYVVLFNQTYPDPIQKPMLRYQFLAVPCSVFPDVSGGYISFQQKVKVLETSLP